MKTWWKKLYFGRINIRYQPKYVRSSVTEPSKRHRGLLWILHKDYPVVSIIDRGVDLYVSGD